MKNNMRISEEVMEVAFGGLLHDIGKVRQRMNPQGIFNKSNLEHFCPYRDGRRKYIHVGHTAEFLAECVDNNIFNENIRRIAASHHMDLSFKSSPAGKAVQIADRLASGMDRKEYNEKGGEGENEKQQRDYIRSRLISIFSQLKLSDNKEAEDYINRIEKLNFNSSPEKLTPLTREEASEEYSTLWKKFEKDFSRMGEFTLTNNYLNALSSLMELYFWCIPASSYKNIPDISLYDHCRLASGIASSIYRYHQENNDEVLNQDYINNKNVFLLIQGNFSGIQKFIFDFQGESHKYAAKILRAKSFYVSMATETAAIMVCEAFGIPHTAILLNAGGKFTIIAPNLRDAENKISSIRNEINHYFTEKTFGQTRFNISLVEISGNDLRMGEDNPVSVVMKRISVNLERDKLTPSIEKPVFTDYLEKFKGEICNICGYRPADSGESCRVCNTFRKLGEDLVRSDKTIISIGRNINGYGLPGGWNFNFKVSTKGFQMSADELVYSLEDYSDETPSFEGMSKKFIASHIPVFSEEELYNERYEGLSDRNVDEEFRAGSHKTFSHIGADGRERIGSKFRGASHIAVLKADVDNMGEMFIKGFGDKTNFSRIATLSRMFNFFFTGWLQRFIKSRGKYNSVYTVFAGGDDFFLIGPWKSITDLAWEIREHLRKYSALNKDIHISAGIVLSRPQTPVRKLADRGEDALEKSKSESKNRITVFDRTVRWDEYREMIDFSDQLFEMMEEDNLSAGYIYNLFRYSEMREKQRKEPRYAIWNALFRYNTYRNYKGKLYGRLLEIPHLILKYGSDLKIAMSRCLYRRR